MKRLGGTGLALTYLPEQPTASTTGSSQSNRDVTADQGRVDSARPPARSPLPRG